MKKTLLLLGAILGILILGSCSSGEKSVANEGTPAQAGGDTSSTTDGEQTDLPDHALISLIEATPAVTAPGSQVSLTGESWITGTPMITGPAGTTIVAELNQGSGTVTLPADAAEGIYLVQFESADGSLAFGSFRVAAAPGVWVASNQQYSTADQPTVLTISAFDLPPEVVAAVYLGQISEGAAGPLVPDENGALVPGDPVALADFVGQALLVPAGYEGALQVGVQQADPGAGVGIIVSSEARASDDSPAVFDGWTSNLIQVRTCDQPGTLSGDLGGPGFVNLIWANGTLQSTSTYTATGTYALNAGPGTVLVQSFPVDGETAAEPRIDRVEIRCGETVETSRAMGFNTPAISRPSSLIHSASLQRVGLTIPPLLPIMQSGGGEPCRTGLVVPRVSDADGFNRSISTLAGLALKTALNEAASQAVVNSLSDMQALLEAIGQAQLRGEDEEAWLSMLEAVQSMAASDFIISLNAFKTGQSYAVNTYALPILPEDALVRGSGQGSAGALFDSTFGAYASLAENFRQAAICGKADPERAQITMDEELSITYRVTDLAGEGADGAAVSISPPNCGRLDPDSGSIEGDDFETNFTFHTEEYCAEQLTFEAEWSGPQGQVQTREGETIVYISPELPELALYAGAAPGIGNTAVLASAITLQDDYDVHSQPASLPAFTQDPACGFLDGGLQLDDQWFFARSESSSKRADSLVEIYTSADEIDAREDVPVDRVLLRMQLDTWAIELEDDNVIRGAWASGANASDPNLTRTPGTLLVFDVKNPGNLPVTPIMSWQLGGSIEKASDFSVLVFYKVIDCGDDPAIGSLFSFVGDGAILVESDTESPGSPTGLVTLPEFEGERQQIIMWVTSVLTSASIRDDDSGADIYGRGRLKFMLSVNLAQELH